jgi:CRISP-associated protein Cas1
MIKRTVEISGKGNRLSISTGSLCIARNGEEVGRVPLEDLGVLLLDSADTVYTHWVLTEALEAGAVIIPCGRDHLPKGIFLPQNNVLQTQRVLLQAACPLPLRKRLWKEVVRAKILNQAGVLKADCPQARKLEVLARQVRSGDPTNREAQAAKLYWPALFGNEFRRDPQGALPNAFLNYGYMVIRAAVARAIVSAGLHPSMGLHHSNRGNHFCLADDLLEPLRPMVDKEVVAIVAVGHAAIDEQVKYRLLSLLSDPVTFGEFTGPLMVGLQRMVGSFVDCLEGSRGHLDLPQI